MNAYTATLVNGIVLIAMSAWAYLDSGKSFTALIPAAFGIVFLALSPGVKKQNKIIAHIVVVLALVVLVALVKPLTGTLDRESTVGTARVLAMMATSLLAMMFYVKSFIDARKAKGGA